MMCGMRPMKLPRWIGMCSAWQSVSPAALNSAVEQSRRSLMLVECEARISVSPVSSTIEPMAAPITSTVIGSMLPLGHTTTHFLKPRAEKRPRSDGPHYFNGNLMGIENSAKPFSINEARPDSLFWSSELRLEDQVEPAIDARRHP